MSKILVTAAFTLLLLCLPFDSEAQNPCSELTSVLDKSRTEKNTLPQTFSSKEGRFKIGLPPVNAVKSEASDEQKAFPQPTRYKWFALNLGRFEISYYDTDRKLDDSSVSQTILDKLRNSLMSKDGAELQTDKELTIRSFPGREVKIKADTGITIARFYLAESRLYIISAFIPIKLECAVEGATKVLNSFELINEK